jgi:hypothetical protein
MHALTALDYAASAPATPSTHYPLFYLALTAVLAIAALLGRKRQLLV